MSLHAMTSDLVIESLDMSLKRQGIAVVESLATHRDRGSPYVTEAYRDRLAEHKITARMSGRGDCCDNAFVESFFGL